MQALEDKKSTIIKA